MFCYLLFLSSQLGGYYGVLTKKKKWLDQGATLLLLREEGLVREVSMGMNTTVDHNGVEPTIALLQQAPAGTFDSVLFA